MGTLIQAQRLSELVLDDCVAMLTPSANYGFFAMRASLLVSSQERLATDRVLALMPHTIGRQHGRGDRTFSPGWAPMMQLEIGNRRFMAHLLSPKQEMPPAPDAAELFKGFAAEEWIERAVRERQRSAFFWLRASAAGLVFRFWVPRVRGIELLARKKGEDHPITRARAWVNSLGDKELTPLEAEAVEVASGLVHEIALVEDAFVEADCEDFLINRVLTRRDDLESALQVLRVAGRGEQLRRQLESVDDAAACHALAFVGTPERERSERLAYVATCEPDAWWSEA